MMKHAAPIWTLTLVLCMALAAVTAVAPPGAALAQESELFPLAVGHRWTYEQVITEGDSTVTAEQTTTLWDVQTAGGYDMYRALTQVVGGGQDKESLAIYTSRNDSTFQVVPRPNDGTGLALLYFVPEGTATFESWWSVERPIIWTASRVEAPLKVPAGVYSDCYMFEHKSDLVRSAAVLAPGVGVIEQIIEEKDGAGAVKKRTAIRLKKFEPYGALPKK